MREMWSEYRAERMKLPTASLLANTAVRLMQRSTKEHLDSIKRWPDATEEKDLIYWLYRHVYSESIGVMFTLNLRVSRENQWAGSLLLEENIPSLMAIK